MNSINTNSMLPKASVAEAPVARATTHFDMSSEVKGNKQTPPTTDSDLKQAIDVSNAALKQIASSLEFAQDKSTGKTLIRVYDRTTNELIRQFPTEEMLAIAKAVDNFKGLLIHQKA